MKIAKRILVLLLIGSMLLSCLGITGTGVPSAFEEKAGAELKAAVGAAPPDALLSVWIFMKDIEDDEINAALKARTGFDTEDFADYAAFQTNVADQVERRVLEEAGPEEAYRMQRYNDDVNTVLQERTLVRVESGRFFKDPESNRIVGRSLVEQRVNEAVDTYLAEKRALCKEEFTARNAAFAADFLTAQNEVIFSSVLSPTVIVKMTKNQIYEASRDSRVESLGLYVPETPVAFSDIARTQTKVSDVSGSSYNNGNGYKGNGIIVGVLENHALSEGAGASEGAKFVRTKQLNDTSRYIARDCRQGANLPLWNYGNHATNACSILAGMRKQPSNGTRWFEGVASGVSKMIQYPVAGDMDALRSVENLIESGGNLVSWSGGLLQETPGYSEYDRQADYYSNKYGLVFVCAAGNGSNTHNVASPARAYNTIAVGNAATKNGSASSLSVPYAMNATSAGVEAYGRPNKPDIAAPGTDLQVIGVSDTQREISDGTSWATPQVAGTVALMMQKNSYYKTNAMVLKAVLLNGADESKISASNNPQIPGTILRELSGTGFLDAKNAIDFLADTYIRTFSFTSWQSNTLYDRTIDSFYLPAGYRIKVTAYAPASNSGTSVYKPVPFELKIRNHAGSTVAYSFSDTEHVQQLIYTPITTGTYSVVVTVKGSSEPVHTQNGCVALRYSY